MSLATALLAALALDAIFGEPPQIWSRLRHPAILAGQAISWLEQRYNRPQNQRAKGAAVLALLVAVAAFIGFALAALPGRWSEIAVVAILLAQRSLAQHVSAVAAALRLSLPDGRLAVAQIVGRDTAPMDEADIARSAIESAAENFSDGVLAPAFWFLIAGLPGILVYKVVNTADSMIGHLTPRYANFGWAAAKFDDLLNWLPARLSTLVIMPELALRPAGWANLKADAHQHRSPNAGWPEAAMARALGVALSGPRTYNGQRKDYPLVNKSGNRQIGAAEIDAATARLWKAWWVMAGGVGLWALFIG